MNEMNAFEIERQLPFEIERQPPVLRGSTVDGTIIDAGCQWQNAVLSKRLPAGSQLRQYFRVPERVNNRLDNHRRWMSVTECSALQTSPWGSQLRA